MSGDQSPSTPSRAGRDTTEQIANEPKRAHARRGARCKEWTPTPQIIRAAKNPMGIGTKLPAVMQRIVLRAMDW
ncbi:hypothetical protein BH11PLA2_BH11PLA2_52050 [soil metagenome]